MKSRTPSCDDLMGIGDLVFFDDPFPCGDLGFRKNQQNRNVLHRCKGFQRMVQNRLTTQEEELFRDIAFHP